MAEPAPDQRRAALRLTHVEFHREENEVEKRPLDLRLILRLFSWAKPYKRTVFWLSLLVLARSAQLPLTNWALARVLGQLGDRSLADHWTALQWGIGGFLVLAFSTDFLFHFRQRLALQLGENVVHDLRQAIVAHLHRMQLGFFHRTKHGRIISRITSDVDAVRSGVQDVFFVSTVQGGQMLIAAALMAWCDWPLFLLVLMLVPVLWSVNYFFRHRMSVVARAVQESFSRVTATIAESIYGVRVTQGFVRQDVNADLFGSLMVDHARYNLNVARVAATFTPLLDFNSQFFIANLLLLGGWQLLYGSGTSFAELIQFFFLANMFFGPIGAIANQYNQAMTAMAGAERVFRLLDTKPDWQDATDAQPIPPLAGQVEFNAVDFAYDPGRPVLHGITFRAEPGQTVAVVGHTGCGKTTITNLIAKFYLPGAGQVLIDGHDILTVTSDSLHRQLGIVQQLNFLFSGTIIDNIRIGRPTASDDEVRAAARRLGTLDLIEALPQGFATVVGEKGAGVSLGQRQLISFTRAMLADPRILILDEATSSVDAITEARLQQALVTLLAGRTSFVVAHRLSTIRHADQVLVMDRGRIVERGKHLELLEQGGLYAELYRQFSQSRDERFPPNTDP
jgi:ATP-binding cassette subfamily B protein